MVLTGVIDPLYQGETGLPLQNGGKEEHVWSTSEILGCPVIKVNRKLQQLNPGQTRNGLDLSGMKVWVATPGK